MIDKTGGIFFDTLDSTMDEAARYLQSGAEVDEADFIQARLQTAGRGRRSRTWVSTSGNFQTTYFIKLGSTHPPITTLSFVCALAVLDMMKHYVRSHSMLSLKWPNDILWCGRKLGGLLLETFATQETKPDWILLGVGINLVTFPSDAVYPTTSVLECTGELFKAEEMAIALRSCLKERLNLWHKGDYHTQMEEWMSRAHNFRKRISIMKEQGGKIHTETGIFEGIDLEGSLLLRRDDGQLEKLTSGDVYFNFTSA